MHKYGLLGLGWRHILVPKQSDIKVIYFEEILKYEAISFQEITNFRTMTSIKLQSLVVQMFIREEFQEDSFFAALFV